MLVWICISDLDSFIEKQDDWTKNKSDDFVVFFVAITVNNVLNFVMTLFSVFMLEKMSRATWSVKFKDTREAR